MSIEAMKLALEALKTLHDENMDYFTRNKLGSENNQCMVFAREAIDTLRAVIEQAEKQKPIGWLIDGEIYEVKQVTYGGSYHPDQIPLYTAPPQREWQGLSDKEKVHFVRYAPDLSVIQLIEAVEEELKDKNGC